MRWPTRRWPWPCAKTPPDSSSAFAASWPRRAAWTQRWASRALAGGRPREGAGVRRGHAGPAAADGARDPDPGLVLDPVYTGKALCGLWSACERGEAKGARVLFVHTGGLPGLLAQSSELAPWLEAR